MKFLIIILSCLISLISQNLIASISVNFIKKEHILERKNTKSINSKNTIPKLAYTPGETFGAKLMLIDGVENSEAKINEKLFGQSIISVFGKNIDEIVDYINDHIRRRKQLNTLPRWIQS